VLTSSLLDCFFLVSGGGLDTADITSCRKGEPRWWEPVAGGGRCEIPDCERGIGPTNRTADDADMMSSPGPITGGAKYPSLACIQKNADIDSKPDLSDLLDVQHLERATDPLKNYPAVMVKTPAFDSR
jgi:hypothetical protein